MNFRIQLARLLVARKHRNRVLRVFSGSEVITAVKIQVEVFWAVAPYSVAVGILGYQLEYSLSFSWPVVYIVGMYLIVTLE